MESRAGKRKQRSEKRTVPRYVNVNYMREITFAYFYNDLHHFLSSSFSRYPSSRTWHAIHPTEFHNARSQPDRRSLAKFWSSAMTDESVIDTVMIFLVLDLLDFHSLKTCSVKTNEKEEGTKSDKRVDESLKKSKELKLDNLIYST